MYQETAKTAIQTLRDTTIAGAFVQGELIEKVSECLRETANDIQRFSFLPEEEMARYDSEIQTEFEKQTDKVIRPADFAALYAAVQEMVKATDDINRIRNWMDAMDCVLNMIPEMDGID